MIEAAMDKAIRRKITEALASRLNITPEQAHFRFFCCPLCGEEISGHDDAACEEGLANMELTGVRGFVGG